MRARVLLFIPFRALLQVDLWMSIWEHKAKQGALEVTATPEYGPAPYFWGPATIDGKSGLDEKSMLWAQTLAGASHLRRIHSKWARERAPPSLAPLSYPSN